MGIDAYGFSILPAGFDNGGSNGMGSSADFWTSTVYSTDHMYKIELYNSNDMGNPPDGVCWIDGSKDIKRSVRCLKDSTNP